MSGWRGAEISGWRSNSLIASARRDATYELVVISRQGYVVAISYWHDVRPYAGKMEKV